jgi:hypothetical protein
MKKFLTWIVDLFRRSPQGAGTLTQQPGVPGQGPMGAQPVPGQVIERVVERQVIPGTPVGFAVAEEVSVGGDGSLDRTRTVVGLLAGCGHLISDYDHLGGRCNFCEAEAQELLAKGQIDLYSAHSYSLYCAGCGTRCRCGLSTCQRHAARVQQADGQADGSVTLCPRCAEDHRKAQLVQRVLGIVLGPFISVPPPEQGKENLDGTR